MGTPCCQVVGWECQGLKTGTDAESLAEALVRTGGALQTAVRQKELSEALEKAGLAKVRPWLDGVAKKAAEELLKPLEVTDKRRHLTTEKLMASKLPSVKEEAAYRQVGVRCVGQLAQQTGQLEQDLKQLQSLRGSIARLKLFGFSSDMRPAAAQVFEDFEAKSGRGLGLTSASESEIASDKAMRMYGFHVAAVAAMCLVRSDALSGPKPDPKALKNLADITASLKEKYDALAEDRKSVV